MQTRLILASASEIRAALLRNAGVAVEVSPARVDEDSILAALKAEGAHPRDIADTLAEMKARKIAEREFEAVVLGCDQVLEIDGAPLSKPPSPDAARAQLGVLRGKRHKLHSAVVLYENGEPAWRHVGEASLTMRDFSDAFLSAYVERNWESIRHSVGSYKLEEEGARLFDRVDGDYFTVLGLPLLKLLGYLGQRGFIAS